MMPRPDLLDEKSPDGIEVLQLTTETDVPSSHIYMEAQIFTSDSKRLVLHRSATPHGSNKDDPEHRYLVCDLENDGALSPVTDELGATGPSVSPDGEHLYYLVNRTEIGGGTLKLKRVKLDGSSRETVAVVDGSLPGCGARPGSGARPSRIYPLSTISSDDRAVATSGYLGDGKTQGAPFGLLVFDLETGEVSVILEGPSWCNIHPQYCRSTDLGDARDILVQENHGNECDAQGRVARLTGGNGGDIHVIRDDGTNFRALPWGRNGVEFIQGHQCWRGRSRRAITSTSDRADPEDTMHPLIESTAVESDGHDGIDTPGAVRNVLTREFSDPHFFHFATDVAGKRLVTDWLPPGRPEAALYVMDLPDEPGAPAANITWLLDTRSSRRKETHVHPFLSPDGRAAFFNSDESGVLQAYMIGGL